MAYKGTKIINQWQRRELIDLNGNEEISIAFYGNEGIFSSSVASSTPSPQAFKKMACVFSG